MSEDIEKKVKLKIETHTEGASAGLRGLVKSSEELSKATKGIHTGLRGMLTGFSKLTGIQPSRLTSFIHKTPEEMEKAAKNAGKFRNEIDKTTSSAKGLAGVAGNLKSIFAGLTLGALSTKIPSLVSSVLSLNAEMEDFQNRYASGFALQGAGSFVSNKEKFKDLKPYLQEAALRSPGSTKDMISAIVGTANALANAKANVKEQAEFGELVTMLGMSQMGGDVKTAASQIQQMMEGRSGVNLGAFQLIKKSLGEQLQKAGLVKGEATTEIINAVAQQDPRHFFESLTKAMASLHEAGEAYGNSFMGLKSTIGEYIENIQRSFGAPVFEYIREQMKGAADWLEKNSEKVNEIATGIGKRVVGGIKTAVHLLNIAYKHIDLISGVLTVIMARKAAIASIDMFSKASDQFDNMLLASRGIWKSAQSFSSNIWTGAKGVAHIVLPGKKKVEPPKIKKILPQNEIKKIAPSLANNPLYFRTKQKPKKSFSLKSFVSKGMLSVRKTAKEQSKHIGSVLKAKYASVRHPGETLKNVIPKMTTQLKALPQRIWGEIKKSKTAAGKAASGIWGGIKSGYASTVAGIAPLISGLTGLAAVLIPLGALAFGTAGAFLVLKDKTNEYTIEFKKAVHGLLDSLNSLAEQLNPGGGGMIESLKTFTYWMGQGMVWTLTKVTEGIRVVVDGWGGLIAIMKAFWAAISPIASALSNGEIRSAWSAAGNFGKNFFNAFDKENQKRIVQAATAKQAQLEKKKLKEANDKASGNGAKGSTNVHVTINQEIKTDANPDRIAYSTREILEKTLFARPRSASEWIPG